MIQSPIDRLTYGPPPARLPEDVCVTPPEVTEPSYEPMGTATVAERSGVKRSHVVGRNVGPPV